MKGLLVHGCYDHQTFRTLESLGVGNFAFDLRARSTNLITFQMLKDILPLVRSEEVILVFENDTTETVLSYLDLLKQTGKKFLLEFRDQRDVHYYEKIGRPFLWCFSPEGDWQKILTAKNCAGVILPVKYQSLYHDLPHLWTLIENRGLSIWLHAENFSEAAFFDDKEGIQASLDLTSVARTVDQITLRTMKFWRKINESASGQ
ncbi:MAG: hypothetical protein ACJ76H_08095 [Bacteriovoracaceae bacterium]